MNQEELRLHRCCFTGHRPDKMELGEKENKQEFAPDMCFASHEFWEQTEYDRKDEI